MSREQPASPKALAYIKAMSGEEDVKHIELSPDEGAALLDRLRKEPRLRKGPYTVKGKDRGPQQACRRQLWVLALTHSLMMRSFNLGAAR
jgi:hypothetical protein